MIYDIDKHIEEQKYLNSMCDSDDVFSQPWEEFIKLMITQKPALYGNKIAKRIRLTMGWEISKNGADAVDNGTEIEIKVSVVDKKNNIYIRQIREFQNNDYIILVINPLLDLEVYKISSNQMKALSKNKCHGKKYDGNPCPEMSIQEN